MAAKLEIIKKRKYLTNTITHDCKSKPKYITCTTESTTLSKEGVNRVNGHSLYIYTDTPYLYRRLQSTFGMPPTVTIKAKIDVVKEIREALTPTQFEIFEKTCFGHWLNVGLKKNSQLLIHTVLACMVEGKENELSFLILGDVIDIFNKMRNRTLVLEDNDAVRICLLVLLQQGFLGHQLSHNVSDDMLKCFTSRKSVHDVKRREEGNNSLHDELGFVWAFMIWILEAIPATHRYLAPSLETLTPTKAESETDWWKASLEYFEGKHVQSEVVSEQLDIEKDGISEKKRKRSSSESSLQDPTYDQLMTTVTKLEGTVATLTETVSTLHGTIGTLESRLLTLEGDARVSTLTQTVSSLQCTINTLESRLLALEGDERDFGVLKDTKDAAKDVAKDAAKDIHIDASDSAALKSFCKEDELQFIGLEKGDKPDYALPDLSKIKRKKYPIYSMFEKKKTDCYLDCLPKGLICEPSFWDVLYPGGEKAEYLEEGKLDGLVFFPINLGNKHWVAAAWNLDDYVLMVS
ncbi:hypothetical protein Tco_0978673 [Tanacetum coccineum]|uniref:Ubiquitin-like protease family profile domain-containing protein n=1 Tax=Tanacetum coccineum TaxID=301880 RepID=A0ABQ5ENM0_9ASTR